MSTVLTTSAGLSPTLARPLTACNSVQYLLRSFLGIRQVERWGRRKTMIIGATGQWFCYIIITVLIRYNEMPRYLNIQQVASGSLALFFLYFVVFGIAMQGIPWLHPTKINSLTMRTGGGCNWRGDKLDPKLHGRRNHTHRNPESRLAFLYRLNCPQCGNGTNHVPFLSGDRATDA
ncbi:hypothetical protein BDW71DRAFT_181495 [Aspergillus fruticulosus]